MGADKGHAETVIAVRGRFHVTHELQGGVVGRQELSKGLITTLKHRPQLFHRRRRRPGKDFFQFSKKTDHGALPSQAYQKYTICNEGAKALNFFLPFPEHFPGSIISYLKINNLVKCPMQSSLSTLPPAFTPCKKSWQSLPGLVYQTVNFFNYFKE